MKKVLIVTVVALLACSSVSAQTNAQINADNVIYRSMGATLSQHLARRGLAAQNGFVQSLMPDFAGLAFKHSGGSYPDNWGNALGRLVIRFGADPLRPWYGFPKPLSGDECYMDFCNGDDFTSAFPTGQPNVPAYGECGELQLYSTADGSGAHVMTPTVPLGGSAGFKRSDDTFGDVATNKSWSWQYADTASAGALWSIHHSNVGRPRNEWAGVVDFDIYNDRGSGNFDVVRPAHQDPITGSWVPRNTATYKVVYNSFHWMNSVSQDCPPGNAGGDYHFYSYSSSGGNSPSNLQDGCTFYEPNYSLGPSGYAYPTEVPMYNSGDQWASAINDNVMMKTCPLSPEFLRAFTDRVWLIMTSANGYTGPAYDRIALEDVRWSPRQGIGLDLIADTPPASGGAAPDLSGPVTQGDPGRAPDGYTPTNPGNNSGGGNAGGANYEPIDLSHPNVDEPEFSPPDFELVDWLPGLSGFQPPTSVNCPLFGFQAMGQSFTMDQLCPMIEEQRSLIANIMVVVFTAMSFLIILRA